jgi:SAM-dependent methyltransferase
VVTVPLQTDQRKQAELAHGRSIVSRAAAVWGQHGRAGQERVLRRSRLLGAAVDARPGRRILELGCGTGEYTARLAGTGATIVALDLVPELLLEARGRRLPSTVQLLLGDAERLPFADGEFDAVVGNAVLHHLHLGPALAEVYRVLKADRRCAFSEPNMLNPQVAVQKNVPAIKRWLGDTPHETAFVAPQMRRALARAGLDVEQIRPFDFLHPAVPHWAVTAIRRVESRLEALPVLCHLAGSLLIVGRRRSVEGQQRPAGIPLDA